MLTQHFSIFAVEGEGEFYHLDEIIQSLPVKSWDYQMLRICHNLAYFLLVMPSCLCLLGTYTTTGVPQS